MSASPLNIAMIAPNTVPVPCFDGYGGTERVVYEIAMGLAERGHAIRLYCAEGSTAEHTRLDRHELPGAAYSPDLLNGKTGPLITAADFADMDRLQEVNYRRFEVYGNKIAGDLEQQKSAIDVVNLHHNDPAFIKKIASVGIPMVVGLHNDVSVGSLPKIDGIYTTLSTSHHDRVAQGQAGFVLLNAGVARHSDDHDNETNEQGQLPANLPTEYLAYVGAISRRKGVLTAIQIARNADVPLVIAGPVLPWTSRHYADTSQYFREQIQPCLDKTNVLYIPSVNEAAKRRLLSSALATLVASGHEDPSWQEPFGRVIAESMLAGTPVLASHRTGGASDFISPNSGYVFKSVTDAADRMPEMAQIDHEACRTAAENYFSLDKHLSSLEQILSSQVVPLLP